jgi:hypothetical protein
MVSICKKVLVLKVFCLLSIINQYVCQVFQSFPIRVEGSDGISYTAEFEYDTNFVDYEIEVLAFCEEYRINQLSCKTLLDIVSQKLDKIQTSEIDNISDNGDWSNLYEPIISVSKFTSIRPSSRRIAFVYLQDQRSHMNSSMILDEIASSKDFARFDNAFILSSSCQNIEAKLKDLTLRNLPLLCLDHDKMSMQVAKKIMKLVSIKLHREHNQTYQIMFINNADDPYCRCEDCNMIHRWLQKTNSSIALLSSGLFDIIGLHYLSLPYPRLMNEIWWTTSSYLSQSNSLSFIDGIGRVFQYGVSDQISCDCKSSRNHLQAKCSAINVITW